MRQVFFDFDGVLNNMLDVWVAHNNEASNKNLKPEDILSWNGIAEQYSDINAYAFLDDHAYHKDAKYQVEVEHDMLAVMEKCIKHSAVNTQILTSTMDKHFDVKMLWMNENLIMENVRLTHIRHDSVCAFMDVSRMNADYNLKVVHDHFKHNYAHKDAVLVDDRAANCENFVKAGGKAILYRNKDKYKFNCTHELDSGIFDSLPVAQTPEDVMNFIKECFDLSSL